MKMNGQGHFLSGITYKFLQVKKGSAYGISHITDKYEF